MLILPLSPPPPLVFIQILVILSSFLFSAPSHLLILFLYILLTFFIFRWHIPVVLVTIVKHLVGRRYLYLLGNELHVSVRIVRHYQTISSLFAYSSSHIFRLHLFALSLLSSFLFPSRNTSLSPLFLPLSSSAHVNFLLFIRHSFLLIFVFSYCLIISIIIIIIIINN